MASLTDDLKNYIMKRIFNIAKIHEEATQWDIKQAMSMTPEERQSVARELRERVYGKDNPDVREWHRMQRGEK